MPGAQEDTGPLEETRKRLYSPGTSFDIHPSSLSAKGSKVPHGWTKEAGKPQAPQGPERPGLSRSALFLMGAAGFFLIALIVAFFLVVQGGRSVSNERVKITIENPPTSIAGGDTVSLFLVIKNENPATLTDARLLVDFPDGTYSADKDPQPLSHEAVAIGTIGPGESVKRTVRATLFGEANQGITIPMTLEYRTEGSNAVFEKKESFDFTIGTSPVSVNVDALSEVSSGQEMTFDITIRSNAPAAIDNLAITAEYPFGFSFTGASQASVGNTLFKIGTLQPGEQRTISIRGILGGQDKDERVFRFSAGTSKADGSGDLSVSFITKEALVAITRPFIAVSLSLDRSDANSVAVKPGAEVQGIISWQNTLPTQILDGEIEIHLSGAALDKKSIASSGGFYRSSDTTIVFNRDTTTGLRTLQPGDSGASSFTFTSKSAAELATLHNPSITVNVAVAGRRVGETGVTEEITSTLSRTVQVASQLSFTATASRSAGPNPPTPDVETSYVVTLSVGNGVNAVAGAIAKATLPSYVRFVSGSEVVYNATSRELSWNVGDLAAHASPRSTSFEVAFLPSLSQVGVSPVIVTSPTLSAFDRYIQEAVTATAPSIDAGARVK